MTRRATIWMAVAALFTVVNLAGAVYAAMLREQPHALLHVALTFGGAFLMWRIAVRSREHAMTGGLPGALPVDERLEQLQQSIDAVARETERIGEKQRFDAKLRAEKVEQPRKGENS